MEKHNKIIENKKLYYLTKTISFRTLFLLIHNEILLNRGAAFVRFADGDFEVIRSVIDKFSLEAKYGKDWMKDLALESLNLNKLSNEIIEAGNKSKYIAPSISGINYPTFDGWHFFNNKEIYFDIFSFYDFTKNMIQSIYDAVGEVGVITRNAEIISNNIKNNFKVNSRPFFLNHYNDIEKIIENAKISNIKLFILSGGPIGKNLAYRLQENGKIVLDLGRSIENWSIK